MISVDEILQNAFCNRSKEQKERILAKDKPRPQLTNLRSMNVNATSNGLNLESSTTFDVSIYDRIEWMTACDIRQSLFCWPCLLFSSETTPWNDGGILESSHLPYIIRFHEKKYSHIAAMLYWKLSRKQLNLQTSVDAISQNELIKRNREIFKRIVHVVCSLLIQQQPPPSGSGYKNQLNIEDCLESMSLIREYDALQCSIIDSALHVIEFKPGIVNDVVDSINGVMKDSIQKELHSSSFVSVIISEHLNDNTKSRISTILRYLKEGKVCERFIGFTNLELQNSDLNSLHFVAKMANKYQITSRLHGIAMDGSTIKKLFNVLDEIKNALLSISPKLFLVPCHFHKMEHVLEQSLCIHKEFDSFFKHLKGMGTYFLKDGMIRKEFEPFEIGLHIDVESFRNGKYPELFENVKAKRKVFLLIFKSILKQGKRWNADYSIKAMAISEFLKNFKTVFLLEVFIKLYELFRNLIDILNSEAPEKAFHSHFIKNLLISLQDVQDKGFEELWRSANSSFNSETLFQLEKDKSENERSDDKSVCHALFLNAVAVFQLQLSKRFELPLTLEFFHTLDHKNFSYEEVKNYARKFIAHVPSFRLTQMLTEMTMLSKTECKSVYDLLQFLREKNLEPSFQNLYKISEFILSLPCKPPSSTKTGSTKLDKIIPWAYTPREQFAGDTSVLCVERDYLQELRKRASFFDDVIAKFIEINKEMELIYRR